jgi:DNA processing protein
MSAAVLDRLARAYLLGVRTPGDPEVAELVAAHGAASAAELLCGAQWETKAAAVANQAKRNDLRLVIPGDAEWPAVELDSLGLWVSGRGHLAELAGRAIGIAGATKATPYGTEVAARLAAELAQIGWTVVTLGRFGIDSAALRGAMQRGRGLVRWEGLPGPGADPVPLPPAPPLVLPLGRLIEPEPRAHAGLFRRVGWEGLLVSEHGTRPPEEETAVDRHRQGRLMVGLVRGLLLVEPGWGSRWLVDAAEVAGVPVLAVPGPVGSEQSQGAHELIRDGRARLVVGLVDILDRLGRGRG